MSKELDLITLAAQRYIQKNKNKLVDNIFSSSPLIAWYKNYKVEPEPVVDEWTEFDRWVKRVRAEQEVIDGINGS